ncbi:acyl carrier protein [Chroococcidiopsidales cyanobacterium LEGE 13417]|uniref:acyl carrier protein n=1 Tax=Chroococcidiopsis sp. CCALA 051 TaxID=869949 RepID=UPI0018EB1049|nr:acyl carrier protein [Chroococcidiopsis sp. CCALA 051]MBE9016056.1 acyl carrier protein [Chroococcidiopsidales cyanobacterium LEGE 13417]
MNTQKAMNTLKAILTELGIPEESIHQDTLLHEDLQLDSTEIVEISLGLKRRLGINLKLESRQDMTIAQICSAIETAILSSTFVPSVTEESANK